MNIIEDGDGRLFEIVEGALEQGEQYELVWQDLDDRIVAFEKDGQPRDVALTSALEEAGRKTVFVRRIPTERDAAPSDGVHRVYRWNVPTAGFMLRALERPAKYFFEKQRASAALDLEGAGAALAELDIAAVADASVDGPKAFLETRQAAAQEAVASADRALAALEALGPEPNGHSVIAISAKVDEMAKG